MVLVAIGFESKCEVGELKIKNFRRIKSTVLFLHEIPISPTKRSLKPFLVYFKV